MSDNQALTTTTSHFDELIANVIADRSFGTATKYTERLNHFGGWLRDSGAPQIDKRTIAAYKESLVLEGKSASTINGHLVAVRALLREAAELGLLDDRAAERVASVSGVAEKGARAGNWLSTAEAQALLDSPDRKTIKGKRDRALLGLMLFCGLRRSELAALTIGHLQIREGHLNEGLSGERQKPRDFTRVSPACFAAGLGRKPDMDQLGVVWAVSGLAKT